MNGSSRVNSTWAKGKTARDTRGFYRSRKVSASDAGDMLWRRRMTTCARDARPWYPRLESRCAGETPEDSSGMKNVKHVRLMTT